MKFQGSEGHTDKCYMYHKMLKIVLSKQKKLLVNLLTYLAEFYAYFKVSKLKY